jgi:hypothetical protein
VAIPFSSLTRARTGMLLHGCVAERLHHGCIIARLHDSSWLHAWHQAPELFTGKHGLTNAGLSIDVYSFGMVRMLLRLLLQYATIL